VSASNLTSPSRSNVRTGWPNPTEYDEGEDPFDPFSNYQYGSGYENGVDSVAQRLQAVSPLSDYVSSHDSLDFSPSWVTNVDPATLFFSWGTVTMTHMANTLSFLLTTHRRVWTTTNLDPRSSASPYVVSSPPIAVDPH
jgi:hypothetical protein